jgi:hypothetical protein
MKSSRVGLELVPVRSMHRTNFAGNSSLIVLPCEVGEVARSAGGVGQRSVVLASADPRNP